MSRKSNDKESRVTISRTGTPINDKDVLLPSPVIRTSSRASHNSHNGNSGTGGDKDKSDDGENEEAKTKTSAAFDEDDMAA
jgi:hypothetical protein